MPADPWKIPFLDLLVKARLRYERQPARDRALLCRVGDHYDCAALKMQKRSWTDDNQRTMANKTGIFFSVWITADGARSGRVDYNIHGLKLRQLSGYRVASIEFCARFRERFEKVRSDWPNVKTDYGPLTLVQGWFAIEERLFVSAAVAIMNRFDRQIARMIDDLLARRKRSMP